MKSLLVFLLTTVSITAIPSISHDCKEPSTVLDQFLIILQQDEYVIQEMNNESLTIRSGESQITIDGNSLNSFSAKRIFQIPDQEEKLYPTFEVYEICLDYEKGTDLRNQILEIVSNRNFTKGKEYDYVVENGNRLIYVVSRAKVFKEFAFEYQEALKKRSKKLKPTMAKNQAG